MNIFNDNSLNNNSAVNIVIVECVTLIIKMNNFSHIYINTHCSLVGPGGNPSKLIGPCKIIMLLCQPYNMVTMVSDSSGGG